MTESFNIEIHILTEKPILTTRKALSHIIDLSLFAIASNLLGQSYDIVNTVYLGWAENSGQNLASKLVGTVTINMFVMALSYTFNGALSTLVAQAYGQKDYRLCGLYLNRQFYLNILIFALLSFPILIFSESIFLLMKFDIEISKLGSGYIKCMIPGLFCNNFYNCYVRFLAGQREMRFNFYTTIITLLIHVILAHIMVFKLHLGLIGVGIANSIQFILRFSILFLFIRFSNYYSHLVSMFEKDCFRNMKQQVKLGIEATFMMIWAWWAFDMSGIFASLSHDPNLMAALWISRNIVATMFMTPLGIEQAAISLIGNMIGENNIQSAKLYFKLVNIIGLVYGITVSISFILFPQFIVGLLSSNQDINTIVIETNLLIAYYLFTDAKLAIYQGVIAGLGMQGRASLFTIISFWLIAIPITIVYLTAYQIDLFGLWIGMATGVTVIIIIYYLMITRSDWHKIAEVAKKRQQNDHQIVDQ